MTQQAETGEKDVNEVKALSWDIFAEKNAEIASLRAQLEAADKKVQFLGDKLGDLALDFGSLQQENHRLSEMLRPGSPTERAPTQFAYDAACAALHAQRDRAEAAEAKLAGVYEALPFVHLTQDVLETIRVLAQRSGDKIIESLAENAINTDSPTEKLIHILDQFDIRQRAGK